ncbi:MAG: DUF4186 domain-containing protein [Phycisphaerae bacterium]|nr:DUF4186 domain-containing protein [Phycisphaerae bacterium]
MREIPELFEALKRSSFRSRFQLRRREQAYLNEKGLEVILDHAREFIRTRLAPARPDKDGKQTPMRNHPVFVAQHATGTCCRKCLEKWHRIPENTPLNAEQIEYIVCVLRHWLKGHSISAGV